MKFNRKILPDTNYTSKFITRKRLHEDEINFDRLRSYRLDRVKKELSKRDIKERIKQEEEFYTALNGKKFTIAKKDYNKHLSGLYLTFIDDEETELLKEDIVEFD